LPALVGLAIAAQEGQLHLVWATLTMVGVLSFQLGTHALNDYYDRDAGDLRPRRMLWLLAYGLFALGTCIGLVLVATRGMPVLWMGLAGFLIGYLYSVPPVRLAHRGLGELSVAIGFGPLILLGTYYVQRQAWSLEAFLASLPLAFLIAAVLYIHEFPDKEGDARVGKRTLIVRLPERSAVVGYMALLALTYLIIVGGVALQGSGRFADYAFPTWSLLGLLTLPLAVKASVVLARNYRYPYRLAAANASTVALHLATGLLFGAGYLIGFVA
jgi:1,4-dihydroxy-2-naphthoate octaprenyltransferase